MTEEEIQIILRNVIDPEIGINIIDLGLIYGIKIKPKKVQIQLTMTTPTCPLHGVITQNMENILYRSFPDLEVVDIGLVWDPPWTPERMSVMAKKQLGWL